MVVVKQVGRDDLCSRINRVAELRAVFGRLWSTEGEIFRRFFFAHRDLIFTVIEEGEVHLRVPVFFAGSEPTEAHEQVLVTATESRLAQMSLLTETAEKELNEALQDAKVAACLLALRFVSRNPGLTTLLTKGEPSWGAVAKAVSADPASLNIFDEFTLDETMPPSADKTFFEKARRYVSYVKGLLRKGDVIKHAATIDLSNNLIPLYRPCRAQLSQLLDARDLDDDDYDEVLQDLYLRRLITNVCTTFWCSTCQDDATILSSRSRMAPDQLRLSCPKCKRAMHVATLYGPHQLLQEAIGSQDGMLGVAIGWLLSARGIPYVAGSYARDQELDYRFTVGSRSVLLEAKMHRTDKDTDATTRNLASDIGQAASHAKQIRKDGGAVDEVWIVTNHDHDAIESELQRARTRHRAKVEAHEIQFVEASALPRALDHISQARVKPRTRK